MWPSATMLCSPSVCPCWLAFIRWLMQLTRLWSSICCGNSPCRRFLQATSVTLVTRFRTNSTEVHIGDGKDVAKWSLRAMSGVEKNTRRQIAQRPKKLISKILNQWAMDTRIYSCWCCVKNVLDSAALFVFVCFLLAVVSFWGFADLLWFPVFSAELLPTVSNIFLVPMEGPWNCGFSCCTFFGLTWGGQQIFMVYMLWWNVSWINNKLSECHRLCSLKGVGFGEFCPKWRFFMKQAIHDLPWLDENLIWIFNS